MSEASRCRSTADQVTNARAHACRPTVTTWSTTLACARHGPAQDLTPRTLTLLANTRLRSSLRAQDKRAAPAESCRRSRGARRRACSSRPSAGPSTDRGRASSLTSSSARRRESRSLRRVRATGRAFEAAVAWRGGLCGRPGMALVSLAVVGDVLESGWSDSAAVVRRPRAQEGGRRCRTIPASSTSRALNRLSCTYLPILPHPG